MFAGAVTRVFNKQEKLLNANPAKLDLAHLRLQIESVQSSSASFMKVHEEVVKGHAEEIDEGAGVGGIGYP